MYISNMSAREYLQYTGSVPIEKVEQLLDKEDLLNDVINIGDSISEAIGQYPSEDFLQDVISRLHDLSKHMRGYNRATLLGIIESLDDIAQCTFDATDYGRSVLKDAIRVVQKAQCG